MRYSLRGDRQAAAAEAPGTNTPCLRAIASLSPNRAKYSKTITNTGYSGSQTILYSKSRYMAKKKKLKLVEKK